MKKQWVQKVEALSDVKWSARGISLYFSIPSGTSRSEISLVAKNYVKKAVTPGQKEAYGSDIDAVLKGIRQIGSEAGKKGIAAFSCARENYLQILPVEATFRFTFHAGNMPYLFPLRLVLEQEPEVGCVVVNQKTAWLGEYFLGEIEEVNTIAGEIPRKVKDFGFEGRDELRMTRRVEERVSQFARDVAEKTLQLASERNWDYLFLAGREKMMGQVWEYFPKPWQEKTLGMLKTDPENINAIYKIFERKVEDFVHTQRELLSEQVLRESSVGKKGRVGLEPVISALNDGSVQALVVGLDFTSRGYICPQCSALSIRGGKCPYCSANLQEERDIIPFALKKAHQQKAQIVLLPNSTWGNNAGIGCLLRFIRLR